MIARMGTRADKEGSRRVGFMKLRYCGNRGCCYYLQGMGSAHGNSWLRQDEKQDPGRRKAMELRDQHA